MAFAQACCRQGAALACTVLSNCLGSILGATRIKTTILSQERTDAVLVCAQQNQQQRFHQIFSGKRCDKNNRISSFRNSAFSAAVVAGPLFALTGFDSRTIQSIGGNALWRNNSRATRLIVLRVTARGAKRFATTTPSRACGKSVTRVYSTKWALRYTGRKRKTDENSSVLTIRRSRA